MTAELRYIDAIHAGLQASLAADDAVVVIGEDVTYGGPFGATKGLADEFGRHRVRDTPISEATVMGMATGAAITGLRPVVEVMFVDFITLAMDQLINHAAKLHFMSGGQLRVPLTVRVQGGVRGRFGAHHSQSLESWFTHTPGLKVVAPAFPGDAKLVVVHEGLAKVAKTKAPGAVVLAFKHFLNDPVFDQLVTAFAGGADLTSNVE